MATERTLHNTTPDYGDGTFSFRVDAVKPGMNNKLLSHTFVKATTAKAAEEAAREILKTRVKTRFVTRARYASCADLGMTTITKES